jgi:hypothetical protein
MKDLIIGTSTNYDWSKLKYWVNSINASGFEGDKVLVLLNCDKETVKKVIDAGFIVVAGQKDSEGNLVHQSAIPVHVERFLFMHNFLTTRDYRYIITTDVKDVVFQHNPIEYIEKNLHEDKDLILLQNLCVILMNHGAIKIYLKLMVITFMTSIRKMKSIM